jgi:hypothetical protein
MIAIIIIMIIQLNSLFIYHLSSTVSGQLQSQRKYLTATPVRQTQGQNNQKIKKMNQLRLFTFKHKFLKIPVYLQTALAAEAEGQWLEE